jgi:putative transposase
MKSRDERKEMVDRDHPGLSIQRQCKVLKIHRSGLYYKPTEESPENLAIMRQLDEQYFQTPFYGIRRITRLLRERGYKINRKREKRLMELMGWQTLYRQKLTTKRRKGGAVYPYLLKGVQ